MRLPHPPQKGECVADTTVPGIVGIEESLAVAIVQRANLTPNLLSREYHPTLGKGFVFETNLIVGDIVPEMTILGYKVSIGKKAATTGRKHVAITKADITTAIDAALAPIRDSLDPTVPGSIAARLEALEATISGANISGIDISSVVTGLRADVTSLQADLNPSNPGIAHTLAQLTGKVSETLDPHHVGSLAEQTKTLNDRSSALETRITAIEAVPTPPVAKKGRFERLFDPGA